MCARIHHLPRKNGWSTVARCALRWLEFFICLLIKRLERYKANKTCYFEYSWAAKDSKYFLA